ncbi:MAG: hypothetical protein HQ559_11400 [Lentisphaerae bacterium]|nr:hypothetical protein [Lentisphaerota bacterium]
MTTSTRALNDALMLALQRGVPLTGQPFADVGAELGLTEEDVIRSVRDLFDEGVVRRFGAVFDSRSLGYGSTLCAVDVPDDDMERVAALLDPHPGVTHCYQREGHPNLWFTLTAPASRLQDELAAFAAQIAPYALLDLPAIRRFKVQVVLDTAGEGRGASQQVASEVANEEESGRDWPEHEKALVRKLQGNLPVMSDPFGAVADTMEWDPADLLDLLVGWQQRGILRRVGIILRHRQAGFVANGMCVWRVDSYDVEQAGRTLARCPDVTHCYERPPHDTFPYNLFAMVHAREHDVALGIFEQLSADAGLNEGKMLTSVREFKKSSPVFFCEENPPATP